MRFLFSLAVIVLVATSRALAADNSPGAPATARARCQVTLAEEAELSPREPGIVKDVPVLEGRHVDARQLVLQLDDTKAQQELHVAQAKYFAAKTKADDDINIRYSKAAAEFAKLDLDFSEKSNRSIPGTVPQAKINELKLKCTETSLAIEKATHERAVAEAETGIAAAEVKAAETMIELLKVYSPIDGEIVAVRAHVGEAVQPTQPTQPGVIHVVGLNKLWVEGQFKAADFTREQLDGRPVTVEVGNSRATKISVPGKVVFVSPLTEAGASYLVRAEVLREKRDVPLPLNPGMTVEMVIQVK